MSSIRFVVLVVVASFKSVLASTVRFPAFIVAPFLTTVAVSEAILVKLKLTTGATVSRTPALISISERDFKTTSFAALITAPFSIFTAVSTLARWTKLSESISGISPRYP